jgi:hypothetical protein
VFILSLDISALLGLSENLQSAANAAMKKGVEALSASVYAHIVEEAQTHLHSSREKYLENLKMQQLGEDSFVIELGSPAMFIEEGLPPNMSMVDFLLDDSPKPGQKSNGLAKSKTKTAADGSRYRTIPFQHNKGPTSQTPAATSLTDTIKKEMKRRGAPYGKLENGPDGKPKTGLVRSFDIMKMPTKTANGPGQGKGPIGDVRQGPTGIPFLAAVRVYQVPVVDHAGKDKVKKFIMTFRTVSSKHKAQGRWQHPGLEAKNYFDKGAEWAFEQWETTIVPMVMDDLLSNL